MNLLVKIVRTIIVLINIGLSILLAFAATDQGRTHSAFLDKKPANAKLVILSFILLLVSLLIIYFMTFSRKTINKKIALVVAPIVTIGLGLVFLEVLALN